jgi:hypothetical protein
LPDLNLFVAACFRKTAASGRAATNYGCSQMNIPGYRTEPEQAKRLGLTQRTLQSWRLAGIGLRHVKYGNKVLYPEDAEKEFLKSREIAPVRSRSRRAAVA